MLVVVLFFFCKERFYSFPELFILIYVIHTETVKMAIFGLLSRFEQRLRWRLYSDQFSIFLCSLNLFLNLDLFIIPLRRVFVIKGCLLFRMSFCFKGAN